MDIRGKGTIRQRGDSAWDIYIYYPKEKGVIRIAYDKRGKWITSRKDALEVLIEVNNAIGDKKFDPDLYQRTSALRFNDSIRKWWRENKDRYAPSSQKDYERHVEIAAKYFDTDDVRDTRPRQINDLLNEHFKHTSVKTRNNFLSVLKAFYRDINILDGVEIPTFPKTGEVEYKYRKWCDWDTFIAIVNEVPEQIDREAMIIMRLELLRVGEVRGLRWDDFLFEEDTLIVRNAFSAQTFSETTKTKDFKIKHLHSEVKEMLLPRAGHPKAFVFTHRGKPYSESWLRKQFNLARDKAGYSKELTLSGATRHSSATEGYLRTKDIRAVQQAIGHKDIRTTLKYTHTDKTITEEVIEPKGVVIDFKKRKGSNEIVHPKC